MKFILVAKGLNKKTMKEWSEKLDKDWVVFNVDVEVKKISDDLVLVKLKDC